MVLESIYIDNLSWEEKVGWFEGSVEHFQDGMELTFELQLCVDHLGIRSVWIDDIWTSTGIEIEEKEIKQVLDWKR